VNERQKFLYDIPANKYVQLARLRHEADLEEGWKRGLFYDEDAADHAVDFFSLLKHSLGSEFAGKPFELSPWQEFDVRRPLYGWMKPDNDKYMRMRGRPWDGDPYDPEMFVRRFRSAYIEVGKKNGKSTESSGDAAYLLLGDGEAGAQVYCAATKKDQAKIVFEEARRMIRGSPDIGRYCTIHKANVSVPVINSFLRPLSSDAGFEDGMNPHGAICDEVHRWDTSEMYNMIESSTAARKQPLIKMITTAGARKDGFCWNMRRYVTEILEGVVQDDSMFGYIATLDEGDDPFDESVWPKANPNIGVSVFYEGLRNLAIKAQRMPSSYNDFLRYHMNTWTEQIERWIPMDAWAECVGPTHWRDMPKKMLQRDCYIGMDLSETKDITAVCLISPCDDGYFDIAPIFWVPKATVKRRKDQDRVPYPEFVKQGAAIETDGSSVDYDAIRKHINDLKKRYSIQRIAYDPHNATQLASQLKGDGFEMLRHYQSFSAMSSPCKLFESLLDQRRIRHGGHPLLTWMAKNVAAKKNADGQLRLDKEKSSEKIDGIIAMVMGLGQAAMLNKTKSIYESQGLKTV
jgi:phage terminase large subunit-like protein